MKKKSKKKYYNKKMKKKIYKNLNKIMVTEVLMGNGVHEKQGVKNTKDKEGTI